MGVITVLRGFKIPVTILDRFLVAHHAEPTDGDRPIFHRDKPEAASRLLRAKLARRRARRSQREGPDNHPLYGV